MNTPAIKANGLRKLYRSGLFRQQKFEALKGVNFSVNQGEIFGLLGPNGAGKTTFVKVLLGVIRKTAGDVSVFNELAGSRRARQLVGYLPENLRMQQHLTARTAMELYGNLSNLPTKLIRQRGDELLEMVGLRDRVKEPIKRYSKGMLQRLGLAQAMLHKPKLLILDEPTDGLDPRARADVRTILARLKNEQGTTIFLNSHILQEIELICDRVAILNQGELKYCGTVHGAGEFARTGGKVSPGSNNNLHQNAGSSQNVAQADVVHAAAVEQNDRYWFNVLGTEQQVTGLLSSEIISQLHDAGGGSVRIELRASDQPTIDQVVDTLRSNGVSIIEFNKQRASLEDAFLEILGQNNQPNNQQGNQTQQTDGQYFGGTN